MGIYLPNMEMPESCAGCPIDSDSCELWTQLPVTLLSKVRHEDCPLIEVKGRLIDANVAYDKIAEAAGEESGNYVDMDVVDRGLSETPTIIEAEEEV